MSNIVQNMECEDGNTCQAVENCNRDGICAFEANCVLGEGLNLHPTCFFTSILSHPDCKPPPCRTHCEFGYKKNADGEEICECELTPCAVSLNLESFDTVL